MPWSFQAGASVSATAVRGMEFPLARTSEKTENVGSDETAAVEIAAVTNCLREMLPLSPMALSFHPISTATIAQLRARQNDILNPSSIFLASKGLRVLVTLPKVPSAMLGSTLPRFP